MKINMKKPLFLTTIIALSILIIGAGAVFATSVNAGSNITSTDEVSDTASTSAPAVAPRVKGPNLNDAFSKLTDEQKAEIYKITDSIQSSQSALLDKMVEYGALDKDVAAQMKTDAAANYDQSKTDGKLPMGRGGMGHDGRRGPGGTGGHGGPDGKGGSCPRNADGSNPEAANGAATPTIAATASN